MTLNEPVFSKTLQHSTDRPSAGSSEEKLKTSLTYRAENENSATPDEIGTAEHRPRRGMIYDAPLGLKF